MSGSAFDIVLDELTLARARKGDLRACETIYRLYQGPAFTIAYRICQCPNLAQDVLQEAFINAFKRLKQFRGDAPFWGWLRRVVVNQAISMLRKQPALAPVELEDYHAIIEGDHNRVELGTDLAAAFGQLEAEDRSVVWLHDVEGYNHTEIAELFGMTESFSKTRLSRARARLRELLGQHMNPGQPYDNDADGDLAGKPVPADVGGGSPPADYVTEVAGKPAPTAAGGGLDHLAEVAGKPAPTYCSFTQLAAAHGQP
ncbi:MAG TPA: sigma-70 family RNA polymerase sigma factor [Xanthomonadales bacterium]|nr:sigma-70 family RNA polymerase sigma factor [Xanthomonadales bacterium]